MGTAAMALASVLLPTVLRHTGHHRGMDANALRTGSARSLRNIAKSYGQDLAAMPEEALTASIGGVARTPADYSFEVAVVNNRVAAILRGEDPGPWAYEGWVTAPADKRTAAALQAEVAGSLEAIATAIEQMPDEALSKQISFFGEDRYPHEIAAFAVMHTGYHMGQLNLHQAFLGDGEVHWQRD
jgi:uncharacterized damage-inducible protein DinB